LTQQPQQHGNKASVGTHPRKPLSRSGATRDSGGRLLGGEFTADTETPKLDPFDNLVMESVGRFRALYKRGTLVLLWGGMRASRSAPSLRPLSAALRKALLARHGKGVLILDRMSSLAGLPSSWPHARFAGHGFSGPITDLHARMLLTLLCADTSKLSLQRPLPPARWSPNEVGPPLGVGSRRNRHLQGLKGQDGGLVRNFTEPSVRRLTTFSTSHASEATRGDNIERLLPRRERLPNNKMPLQKLRAPRPTGLGSLEGNFRESLVNPLPGGAHSEVPKRSNMRNGFAGLVSSHKSQGMDIAPKGKLGEEAPSSVSHVLRLAECGAGLPSPRELYPDWALEFHETSARRSQLGP
jgi:hypothetical protein